MMESERDFRDHYMLSKFEDDYYNYKDLFESKENSLFELSPQKIEPALTRFNLVYGRT